MSDAASATTTSTPNATRVLGLVRCLIDFGRGLAETLRHTSNADFEFRYRAHLFGTTDLAVMLARIARGLRRAAALQSLLLARVQRGRDLQVAPVRMSLPSGLTRGPRPPGDAAPEPRPERAPLPLEPSDEEIAADMRRRPVGAVIVDICLDLGVQPGNLSHAMHRELMDTVIFYGGNPIRLLRMDDTARRGREYLAVLRSDAPLPPEHQPFPWQQACPGLRAGAAATGPPA